MIWLPSPVKSYVTEEAVEMYYEQFDSFERFAAASFSANSSS